MAERHGSLAKGIVVRACPYLPWNLGGMHLFYSILSLPLTALGVSTGVPSSSPCTNHSTPLHSNTYYIGGEGFLYRLSKTRTHKAINDPSLFIPQAGYLLTVLTVHRIRHSEMSVYTTYSV